MFKLSTTLLLTAAAAAIIFVAVDAARLQRSPDDAGDNAVDGLISHHGGRGHSRRAGGHHRHRGVGGRNWENSGVGRGLCAPSNLCCQGKDNRCRAPALELDSATVVDKRNGGAGGHVARDDIRSNNRTKASTLDDSECFCDAACLDIGDCCDDYKETCQPIDCILADEWSDYDECSSRCGPGIKQRRRRVIQPAQNGGRPCGKTVEKIPCDGAHCKVARAPNGYEELRETGYIIPAVYGVWRKSKRYDPFSDIRKNLFDHYDAKTAIKRPPYCAVFELIDVHPGCNLTATTSMTGSNSPGPASTDSDLASWTSQLVKGASVCVECQPAAMKKKLGVRCRGQGVLQKETRWDAVTVPGCRGRWVMKVRQDDCQCQGSNNGGSSRNGSKNPFDQAAGGDSSLANLPSFIFV